MARTTDSKDKNKVKAGRLGGTATVNKYGVQHMATIGTQGAIVTHSTYDIEPWLTSDYAMVHKKTGKIVAFLSGSPVEPWMQMMESNDEQ